MKQKLKKISFLFLIVGILSVSCETQESVVKESAQEKNLKFSEKNLMNLQKTKNFKNHFQNFQKTNPKQILL